MPKERQCTDALFTVHHNSQAKTTKYDVKNKHNVSPLNSFEADCFFWGDLRVFYLRVVVFTKRCVGCTGRPNVCSLSCGPHKDTTPHLQGLSEHNQMVVVCLLSEESNIADYVFLCGGKRPKTEINEN